MIDTNPSIIDTKSVYHRTKNVYHRIVFFYPPAHPPPLFSGEKNNMDCNTLTTHKTPYSGSLHNRCPYLPEDHTTYIPLKPGTEQYAPAYPVAHNPLRYKRQEDFQTNISHAYKTASSIAYTQSWDEYHKQLFSYYLYDHLGRPVETGQAKITHIRTGDHDKTLRMTNADIREHVHSLSNRINVMVAIYNDADPFPACSGMPQDHQHDKIATIYHYPCIHAATPSGEDGQYYPSGVWYAAEYHYSLNDSITTTSYQCTAQVQELPMAEKPINNEPLTTTEASCSVATPAHHNHNCPIRTLDYDTLMHLHSQVFNVLYSHQPVAYSSLPATTTLPPPTTSSRHYPYYSTTPNNYNYYYSCGYYNNKSSNTSHTHHCRGDTVTRTSPHHYCHSPPYLL